MKKNIFNVITWAVMIIYLAFARDIYSHFFVLSGKPSQTYTDLPVESDQVKASFGRLEPSLDANEELYRLDGWAFSIADHKIPPEEYERNIVLLSNRRNYFFPSETYSRADIQTSFQSLGMELEHSGLSALISKDVIKPGVYQIGVVFRNHQNMVTYYATTNKYIIRTANQIHLSNSKSKLGIETNGNPIKFEEKLPEETNQIEFYVDSLYVDNTNLYTLRGWAISLKNPLLPPEKYERLVVLLSDKKNYFFPSVEVYPRPDIQSAYRTLGVDSVYAGLLTRINMNVIERGKYRIGIVFRNPQSGSIQFKIINRYITRSEDQMQLSDNGVAP